MGPYKLMRLMNKIKRIEINVHNDYTLPNNLIPNRYNLYHVYLFMVNRLYWHWVIDIVVDIVSYNCARCYSQHINFALI